jgi:hypothetical protein
MKPKKNPGGRPPQEPTKQIRCYAADFRKLSKHGKTQAEAVRELVESAARAKAALLSVYQPDGSPKQPKKRGGKAK